MVSRRDAFKLVGGAAAASTLVGMSSTANASDKKYRFRAQTHMSESSPQGKMYGDWAKLCETLSEGRLKIDLHFSSAIVKDFETFGAAASGILDIDMTGASYQTGKEPAFQFIGDVMGGYENPMQLHAWLNYGGGRPVVDEIYAKHGMYLIGLFCPGVESLSSTKPLDGIASLKDWKFRSPPGMESEIFAKLGAAPVVMPFGEVFTAMTTGVVDGCDAGTVTLNKNLGVYDVANHFTYPGFHSMPADHVAINLKKWNALPDDLKEVMQVAQTAIASKLYQQIDTEDHKIVTELAAKGIKASNWSKEDRMKFRETAQGVWKDWSTRSELCKKIYDSHIEFMKNLGLLT
nr:TRAP transporter substrate-binding protein [uncultured Cohaesibacter sp.]